MMAVGRFVCPLKPARAVSRYKELEAVPMCDVGEDANELLVVFDHENDAVAVFDVCAVVRDKLSRRIR